MTTVIKTKNSTTTTTAPSSLAQGELAVNITDKKVWIGNAATTPVQLLGTGADGSFTNLAYSGTLTGGTGVVNLGSGQFYKDASGNVGIGVTPSAWISSYKALQLGTGASILGRNDDSALEIGQNTYRNSGGTRIYLTTQEAGMYHMYNGTHQWFTAPSGTAGTTATFTEAMRITNAGNLLVGTTTLYGKVTSEAAGANATESPFSANVTSAAGVGSCNVFRSLRGGTQVGSISNTSTATAYNTSSDYRLKDNIAPMTGALATVSALKPVTYKWKADGSDGQGFIAHELAEVVPDCVTGEKDAVDEEGNPRYQGIDTSFLVATLTAAIQEQQAIITDLKARIETLENK